jgi:hypothetical protein
MRASTRWINRFAVFQPIFKHIIIATCIGVSWKPSRSRGTRLWECRLNGSAYCLRFEDREGRWNSNGWCCLCRRLSARDSSFTICGERYVLQRRGMRFSPVFLCSPLVVKTLSSLSLSNWELRNALYKGILRTVITNWSSCIKSWNDATL